MTVSPRELTCLLSPFAHTPRGVSPTNHRGLLDSYHWVVGTMVGVLNAEAAEFIPTAAVVQVAAAASASDAGGDRRQSGRNPRRANRGQAGSTGQHIRISTGRRGNPSSGGRGVNPAHPQRKKWSTRGDEVHPGRAHEATGVESVTSAQRGGRRVGSR